MILSYLRHSVGGAEHSRGFASLHHLPVVCRPFGTFFSPVVFVCVFGFRFRCRRQFFVFVAEGRFRFRCRRRLFVIVFAFVFVIVLKVINTFFWVILRRLKNFRKRILLSAVGYSERKSAYFEDYEQISLAVWKNCYTFAPL